MPSFLLRGLAANGGIRVVAADTTDIVREVQQRHQTSGVASAALGRVLTSTLLLCHVMLKNPQDRLSLRVRGDGPLGGITSDGGLDGSVRGYVQHPQVELAPREDGKLNVGAAVGKGELEIIRSIAPYGDPYSSSVQLYSGEIAEDIAVFLAQSEQINSAVLLGVYLENNEVQRAGGIILQALPDAEEAALTLLEANIQHFGQLSDAMANKSLLQIMEELTWGLGLELLTQTALPLEFSCRCSKAKAKDIMAYFSPEEREQMIEENGGAEVVCHWCNEAHWLDSEDLRSISSNEIRCPDCQTLWYRQGQHVTVYENETCACGRKVDVPELEKRALQMQESMKA